MEGDLEVGVDVEEGRHLAGLLFGARRVTPAGLRGRLQGLLQMPLSSPAQF